jgi:hypothetical protein
MLLWYAALMLWLTAFAPVPKMVLGRSLPQSVSFPSPGGTVSVAPSVTWAHVNGAAGSGFGTSVPLTLGFTPSSGTLLLFACNGRSNHPTSISDNSSGPAELSGNQSGAMTVASPFTARSQSSDYNIMSSDDGVPSGIAASTSRTATYSLTGSAYSSAFIVGFNP